LAADVSDPASLRRALSTTLQHFGGLDAVVANAGIQRKGSILELSEEDWRAVIDTNLSGVFYTARTTAAALAERGGMLITIGSLAGAHAFAGGAAYNASKFGLVGLSEALMLDLRDVGVRVCSVMPGSTATSFSSGPQTDAGWKLRAEDVADAVMYALQTPRHALPSRIELRPAQKKVSP
jgi:NAD(P)-dependent dehydrogenase (short-subunit alcohol dehydrogenase family)